MPESSTRTTDITFEQAFCLCYYCYFEPWTNILAFFLILTAVGTVEGLYRNYRGRRVIVEPEEAWLLIDNELRKMD